MAVQKFVKIGFATNPPPQEKKKKKWRHNTFRSSFLRMAVQKFVKMQQIPPPQKKKIQHFYFSLIEQLIFVIAKSNYIQ